MASDSSEPFLGTPEQCKVAERFWALVVIEVGRSIEPYPDWNRWLLNSYFDGTPFEDQWNPVFDARSRRLDRALKIVQHPDHKDDPGTIDAWIQSYGPEWDPGMPKEELVISLCRTPRSEEIAKVLLAKWMTPTTTTAEMAEFIQSELPRLNERA